EKSIEDRKRINNGDQELQENEYRRSTAENRQATCSILDTPSSFILPRSSAFNPGSAGGLVELHTGGLRWRVTPECREHLFGPGGLRLQEWLEAGQAVLVKDAHQRQGCGVDVTQVWSYLTHNWIRHR